MDALVLVVVLPTQELVRVAIGQAAVEADVLLILREAPEGDEQLQLFWHWRHHLLHNLKGDVRRHRACAHLRERVHTTICTCDVCVCGEGGRTWLVELADYIYIHTYIDDLHIHT